MVKKAGMKLAKPAKAKVKPPKDTTGIPKAKAGAAKINLGDTKLDALKTLKDHDTSKGFSQSQSQAVSDHLKRLAGLGWSFPLEHYQKGGQPIFLWRPSL